MEPAGALAARRAYAADRRGRRPGGARLPWPRAPAGGGQRLKPPGSELRRRAQQLTTLLAASAPWWQPQPYRTPRPAWCAAAPELCAALLQLDDAELTRLSADDGALHAWLRRYLPQLDELAALVALPRLEAATTSGATLPDRHFDWGIPGRKRAQIEAFCAVLGRPVAPVVDWCSGKGHLGRLIAAQWGVEVASIDADAALVDAAARLAARARQPAQRAEMLDVHGPLAGGRLAGRHVVALHACGDLHRALLRAAIADSALAIDVVPCCYQRYAEVCWSPLAADDTADAAPLRLDRAALQLAVTGTATAAACETARRRRAGAWKLGFIALAYRDTAWRPLRPIPGAWMSEDFPGFCARLAQREGIVLPVLPDWARALAVGTVRWREFERLNLVPLAFRRAIEVRIVLDLALALIAAGYAARVGSFCDASLTPRNLLVSARRQGVAR